MSGQARKSPVWRMVSPVGSRRRNMTEPGQWLASTAVTFTTAERGLRLTVLHITLFRTGGRRAIFRAIQPTTGGRKTLPEIANACMIFSTKKVLYRLGRLSHWKMNEHSCPPSLILEWGTNSGTGFSIWEGCNNTLSCSLARKIGAMHVFDK